MIRLFFLDNHPLILEGLRALLTNEADIEICGDATSGRSCLDRLQMHPIDILLMDTHIADIDSVQLAIEINQQYPLIKILALSYHNEDPNIQGILASGAHGCLLKSADKQELLFAIYSIHKGRTYYSKGIDNKNHGGKQNLTDSKQFHITKREKEVLSLIANGHTNHEIAEKLFISSDTVDSHRRNLLGKLKARNTAMLIKCAFAYRLLPEFSI
ncbi:DNA-binding response regulator [Chitinophaga caeni]|uniref:DNA-binding response regulator n=1 Tax=Chitinophaga caeni TaxID=2029983 RepID=A0A291QZD4_9BACT|nr:response regulator transcription factor [Chitinophaga caeni]ATL49203.1 DNA-binding response regulator [Chitinophaga caeni]